MLKNFLKYQIRFNFILPDNTIKPIQAKPGSNILLEAHKNNIDLEGACECSLACSTCHVYLDQKTFNLVDPAEEEEEDLLDLAVNLQDNSRLGCQIKIDERLEGANVYLPSLSRNFYVDK